MPVGFSRRKTIMGITIAALLLAGARLLAQSTGFLENDVRVYPIPAPKFDSGIPFAPAHAAAVTVPSAPNAWGGPRTGSEATLSDRVANYQIEATLDPVRHTVTGKQKLTWRNRSQEQVRQVYLHLYMNAFESGASTFYTEERRAGHALPVDGAKPGEQWGHIAMSRVMQGGAKVNWAFVQPDGGPETDHTVVRLDLPAAVEAGASTSIDIDFITQLPRLYARTGHADSFHLVAQWFPKIGVLELPGERGASTPRWNVHEFHSDSEFYADFGHYDVKLTVPVGYQVGATGEPQGQPVEKDGMATHHYVQGDVHDFAWTADSRSAAPLRATWSAPGSPKVAITVIHPPESAAAAKRVLQYTREALDYFSRTLGPYPYRTLTAVVPPVQAHGADSMEYPTFFTSMARNDVRSDTLDGFNFDFVTIHEAGHGYFYGILASNEFEEPFLDEGVNEYWNHRQLAERGVKLHPVPKWLAALGVAPGWDSLQFSRLLTPVGDPADALGQNAWDRLQGIGPVYDRGAVVLRDLEARIGKDAMARGMKTYYQRWKFRHPSIADLREALAEGSGQRAAVESVFAQQVYATAKVDDRIEAFSSLEEVPQPGFTEAGGKRVVESQDAVAERIGKLREAWRRANPKARADSGPFPYRTSVTVRRRGAPVPQTLLVKFADGSSETVSFDPAPGVQERWQNYSWLKPVPAVSAELDPRQLHYLDANKLDDSRTLKADPGASRRWTADFAAFFNLLLSLIATV